MVPSYDPKEGRRDAQGRLVFVDHPEFRPNLTPKQVIQAGSFGGWVRPLRGGSGGGWGWGRGFGGGGGAPDSVAASPPPPDKAPQRASRTSSCAASTCCCADAPHPSPHPIKVSKPGASVASGARAGAGTTPRDWFPPVGPCPFRSIYFNPVGGKPGILGKRVEIDHKEFPKGIKGAHALLSAGMHLAGNQHAWVRAPLVDVLWSKLGTRPNHGASPHMHTHLPRAPLPAHSSQHRAAAMPCACVCVCTRADWFEGLPAKAYRARIYTVSQNKYGVKAGQDQVGAGQEQSGCRAGTGAEGAGGALPLRACMARGPASAAEAGGTPCMLGQRASCGLCVHCMVCMWRMCWAARCIWA